MSIQISDKSFEGFKQAYATLSAAVTKFQAQAEGAGGKVGTILTQEIYDTARQMLEAGAVLAQEATAKVADVVAEVTGQGSCPGEESSGEKGCREICSQERRSRKARCEKGCEGPGKEGCSKARS